MFVVTASPGDIFVDSIFAVAELNAILPSYGTKEALERFRFSCHALLAVFSEDEDDEKTASTATSRVQ